VSRAVAALAAAALAAPIGAAAAQPAEPAQSTSPAPPAQLVNVIRGSGPKLEQLTLVGESGQLYLAGADGWSRDRAGGIAGDVLGAARGTDGTLYLIGGHAPLYERVDGAWRLRSLGVRSRSRASTLTGAPILVSGRQIYALEADKWRRIGSAPTSRVDAIWASSTKRIALTDDNGEIRTRDGGGWKTIPTNFTAPEQVDRLIGIPNKVLFAIGDAGTIHRVDASGTTAVAVPQELQGFRPTAAGSDDATIIYLAGPMPTADGGQRQVLASLDAKGALALVEELPALANGDRYSLIVAHRHEGLLLGSYAGVVRLRAADGSWTDRTVSTRLPAEKPVAVRAARKPARTR